MHKSINHESPYPIENPNIRNYGFLGNIADLYEIGTFDVGRIWL